MTTSLFVAFASALVLAGCFVGAHHIVGKKNMKHKQRAGDAVGVLLALSLLVFVEALLQHTQGVSFFQKIQDGQGSLVAGVFWGGAIQGIIYEYVGQFTFPLWYYPAAEAHRVLLLGLPLFWGIFMLIMQDTWALFRAWGAPGWLAVLLVSGVQLAIIEGFNLLTHSWKYKGWFNTPQALTVGWVILTLTFVLGYNHYFGSPFGF